MAGRMVCLRAANTLPATRQATRRRHRVAPPENGEGGGGGDGIVGSWGCYTIGKGRSVKSERIY